MIGTEEEARRNAKRAAEHFVQNERAFHLGFLPTEQSHPATSNFSATAGTNVERAIDQIFSVDTEIASVARRIVLSAEFETLAASLSQVAAQDSSNTVPRVCFSGCGSTGRLAIMLEAMWRSAFADDEEVADRAESVMTGGDRALIRAVENFEDYEAFGARQIKDLGLGAGDIVIAISEGGETSSVIGTAKEALHRECSVFFLYNNPTSLLRDNIARSRQLLEDPRVVSIDLFSGPMALSGSTRMQATTLEMLVVGIAIEEAISRGGATARASRTETSTILLSVASNRLKRVDAYVKVLQSLRQPDNRRALGALATREATLYHKSGRVTYFAQDYLLDIFSDTTERSPTFMTPPLRALRDTSSPISWAFAKNPKLTTPEAWKHLLRRRPRGIEWNAKDYTEMHAEDSIIGAPPKLDLEEIYSYPIGCEEDESRWLCDESLALWIDVDGSLDHRTTREWSATQFSHHELLSVTSSRTEHDKGGTITPGDFKAVYSISIDIPTSPINLFHHLSLKLIFNTFSTTTMAIMGRIVGNWMVQVDPTNKKLIDRGTRLVSDLAGITYEQACFELHLSLENRKRQITSSTSDSESPVVTTLRRLGISIGPYIDE